MRIFEYGEPAAGTVLIQPVDGQELAGMENEVREIARLSKLPFRLLAVRVEEWNRDLSPWQAPAVFGREEFGGGAERTLREILGLCREPAESHGLCTAQKRRYILGGYSLAGLFALWAMYQTDLFAAAAAASPSVWFPGFTDYMSAGRPRCRSVYLSLGDREDRSRNPVLASVSDRIRQAQEILQAQGTDCVLEWNPGNHFQEPERRTARAFAWALNRAGGC